MRPLFGFLSLIALGLMVAVGLTLAAVGMDAGWRGLGAWGAEGVHLHYPSLLLGLALGVVMATLARLSWAEMPRRLALWLVANERNFYRLGMAAICLGVLLFY